MEETSSQVGSDSVISLLRDISASLAFIKNQDRPRANSHGVACCKCQCHENVSTEKVVLRPTHNIDTEEIVVEQDGKPKTELDSSSVYGLEDADKPPTIVTEYGAYSPRDDFTLTRFAHRHDLTSKISEIKDRLSRFAPDDHRLKLAATRGNFVRHFVSDASSSMTYRHSQFSMEHFDWFKEAKAKLGVGHFWIRDYDRNGNYAQWDCINHPLYLSIDSARGIKQCDIPPSRWPLHWAQWSRHTPISPWRRIISLRGLSRMTESRGSFPNLFLGHKSAPASMHLHKPHRGRITGKLTDYLPNIHSKKGCLFQITYAKNSASAIEDHNKTAWYSGSLYPGSRYLSTEFQSITVSPLHYSNFDVDEKSECMKIDAVSERLIEDCSVESRRIPDKYWTILFMDPITWYDELEEILKDALLEESSMQIAMLVLVGYALRIATDEWQNMVSYFDTLLSNDLFNHADSTLLSPERHDMLLFEDESFSRSRKYFWVVDAISTFIEKISEALDAWERYRTNEVDPFLEMAHWREHKRLLTILGSAKGEVARLEGARQHLQNHLERTRLLRDGLFQASGVIESRAASELGRNVKLLTYVSIFYLPLSFCTSLWSTTDTFSFTNLTIVMIIIALSTYTIVCNVENIARFGHSIYSNYRKRTVQRMSTDLQTDTWNERAKRFDRFEPDRRSTKPTDWYVLWAAILLLPEDLLMLVRLGLLYILYIPARLVQLVRKNGGRISEENRATAHESGGSSRQYQQQ